MTVARIRALVRGTARDEGGYATVEAALALGALTVVAAAVVAGVVAVAAYLGAAAAARDAARAAAIAAGGDPVQAAGPGPEEAARLVAGGHHPGARVDVAVGELGGGIRMVRVTVTRRTALGDLSATGAAVVEPADEPVVPP